MSNVERYKKICEGLNDLYRRKNADYGDSFSRQFVEYGIISSVIRIEDKFLRLKQLSKNEALVEDETIEDTLVDLANYAIMMVMELQNSKLTGGFVGGKTIEHLGEKIEIYEKALPDNSDVAIELVKENELYRQLLEEVIEEGSSLMIDRIADVLYSDNNNDMVSK